MRLGLVINTREEPSDVSDEAGEMASISMDGPASSLVVILLFVFALPVFVLWGLRSGMIAARRRHAVVDSCCIKKKVEATYERQHSDRRNDRTTLWFLGKRE